MLEHYFSRTAIIVLLSNDGYLLAANQASLASINRGPDVIGLHSDDVFFGYDFQAMTKADCALVLETGLVSAVERIFPHEVEILIRVRQFVLPENYHGEPAMISISLPMQDNLVYQFRTFDPRRNHFTLRLGSDIRLTVKDFEIIYWLQRAGSVVGMAGAIGVTKWAIYQRISSLGVKIEAIVRAEGFNRSTPTTVAEIRAWVSNWHFQDEILAGCINAINKYYGREVVRIAGFDAKKEESYVNRRRAYVWQEPREILKIALSQIKVLEDFTGN